MQHHLIHVSYMACRSVARSAMVGSPCACHVATSAAPPTDAYTPSLQDSYAPNAATTHIHTYTQAVRVWGGEGNEREGGGCGRTVTALSGDLAYPHVQIPTHTQHLQHTHTHTASHGLC